MGQGVDLLGPRGSCGRPTGSQGVQGVGPQGPRGPRGGSKVSHMINSNNDF